ncbi:hypothetical protein M2152_001854 [Microbacteriaceae bacterium SG_E_30_P1]|uniref:Large extracellular alpha-helical protein n=1 Tax=Antiquaquibacter oligotrophicus TaxID=2880260 RepID=A0ABT6KNU4_9MICO|nr:DUF5719 family protein [Antiquaquibacter oligotrophicus]MDH6181672.1 hypothetical protein [Antiquaquibacter oligotrophicus]UDF12644.1 DUF5719 family protein [Antiquaquibacter oligotrophicus]
MSDIEPTGETVETDSFFPEQEEDIVRAREREPMTTRGKIIVGARVATGTIGIAIAVATVAAAALVPFPRTVAVAPSELIVPVPTAQQLVCPGAVLRLADDSGQGATQASAVGVPDVVSASSTGSVTRTDLLTADSEGGASLTAPQLISTPPDEADPSTRILVSGAQAQTVSDGDIVGLAAGACRAASADSWLVGGATTVGRTTLLTLSNPTEVPATVDLEFFGESGPITAPGTSGIVVPASAQRVLSVAGFAPETEAPVVHVTSAGGQVVAELQETIVRGLVPGGVDLTGPALPPSLTTVIPGLTVSGAADIENNLGIGPGFEDLQTILRVFVPGEQDASASIRVIPEDGRSTGTSFDFTFDAGRVMDVPIPELADGRYTVRVDSDIPLLAAGRVSAAAGERTDFAWLAPAPPLTDAAQITIAPGPSPLLHVANPTEEPATVTLTPTEGDVITVEIPAGASSRVQVSAGETYVADGAADLAMAVSVLSAQTGAIAHYTIAPPGVGSSPILIYP